MTIKDIIVNQAKSEIAKSKNKKQNIEFKLDKNPKIFISIFYEDLYVIEYDIVSDSYTKIKLPNGVLLDDASIIELA